MRALDDTMAGEPEDGPLAEIPRQIFEQFVQKLTKTGTNAEVVARLKQTILDRGALSDKAVRSALFPSDQPAP
jgi:hypothetical protein